jgi:hypothetical protein
LWQSVGAQRRADGLLELLDRTLVLIDHQLQITFATKSIDAISLRSNAGLVASSAASFGVSQGQRHRTARTASRRYRAAADAARSSSA